jgi:hypothetical protein
VGAVEFDEATKVLTVPVDFKPGTRFTVSGHEGLHPVHDTVVKTYRHLNFFQHECHLQVRTPRVKLPNGHKRVKRGRKPLDPALPLEVRSSPTSTVIAPGFAGRQHLI